MAWPKWLDKVFEMFPIVGEIISTDQQARTAARNTDATNAANMELARYGRQQDLEQWNRQNVLNQQLWQQQNEYNEGQRDNQRAYEQSIWQQQNEYNSPAAQMKRFKDAGLNPNMIYGQGTPGNAGSIGAGSQVSSAGFQANQLPRYQAPRMQFNYKPSVDIPAAISAYQDFQMRQAQIDNLHANEQATRTKTISEGMRQPILDVDLRRKLAEYGQLEYLIPSQNSITINEARSSEAKLQQEWKRLELMNQEQQLKELQKMYQAKSLTAQDIDIERKQADLLFQKYKNQWMAEGITTSDHVMIRVLIRMMNEAGIAPSALIGN